MAFSDPKILTQVQFDQWVERIASIMQLMADEAAHISFSMAEEQVTDFWIDLFASEGGR